MGSAGSANSTETSPDPAGGWFLPTLLIGMLLILFGSACLIGT